MDLGSCEEWVTLMWVYEPIIQDVILSVNVVKTKAEKHGRIVHKLPDSIQTRNSQLSTAGAEGYMNLTP